MSACDNANECMDVDVQIKTDSFVYIYVYSHVHVLYKNATSTSTCLENRCHVYTLNVSVCTTYSYFT